MPSDEAKAQTGDPVAAMRVVAVLREYQRLVRLLSRGDIQLSDFLDETAKLEAQKW